MQNNSQPQTQKYTSGQWQVDIQSNSLSNSEQTIVVGPKIMDLLVYLAMHASQTISKDDILTHVWGGQHFTDSVVTRAISILRNSLKDDPHTPQYIKTVAKKGYQWIAEFEPCITTPYSTKSLITTNTATDTTSAVSTQTKNQTKLWLWLAPLLFIAATWLLIQLTNLDNLKQTTNSLEAELQPFPPISSIAVLPFKQLPGQTGYDYLAESLQNAVAMQMARYHDPKIYLIPSEQVQAGNELAIASELGVDAALIGTLEILNDAVTVSLRLQNPTSTQLLWSTDYHEAITSTQVIHKKIVHSLVSLTRFGIKRLADDQPQPDANPDAYQAYLKAIWHWRHRSTKGLAAGHDLFLQAVELDPLFSAAYAGLALSYITQANYMQIDTNTGYSLGAAAAEQALQLDPLNAEALTAQAQIKLQRDWDINTAIVGLQSAIQASPGIIDARQYLAEAYSMLNMHQLAVELIDETVALRPYSSLLVAVQGIIYHRAGKYAESIETMQQLERLQTRFTWHFRYWAYSQERMGDSIAASNTMANYEYQRNRLTNTQYTQLLSAISETNGQAYWDWRFKRINKNAQVNTGLQAFLLAEAYTAVGEYDEAMKWIRKSRELRSEAFIALRMSPKIDPLRKRQDYQAFLAAQNLPLYHLP